jgi:hypothetical protein
MKASVAVAGNDCRVFSQAAPCDDEGHKNTLLYKKTSKLVATIQTVIDFLRFDQIAAFPGPLVESACPFAPADYF